jgi:hypothetical protein
MDDRDLRNYEMVLRVRDFGAGNAADFPSTTLGGELFAAIGTAATELAGQVAARSSGSSTARAGTTSKSAAREGLHASLEMIRRTARSMSQETPSLADKFRIPRNMTDQELLGTARAFATDAAPLKSEFLRYAMPASFLEDLNEHIEDFESALGTQHTGRGNQVMATAAFDDALDGALSAVRRLDAVVRNTYHNEPAKLAAWESARHVERAARSKASTPGNVPRPPQP